MQRLSVDRIENNFVICEDEDGKIVKLDKHNLPENISEGDIIDIDGEIIKLNLVEKEQRQNRIMSLQEELFGKDD